MFPAAAVQITSTISLEREKQTNIGGIWFRLNQATIRAVLKFTFGQTPSFLNILKYSTLSRHALYNSIVVPAISSYEFHRREPYFFWKCVSPVVGRAYTSL